MHRYIGRIGWKIQERSGMMEDNRVTQQLTSYRPEGQSDGGRSSKILLVWKRYLLLELQKKQITFILR